MARTVRVDYHEQNGSWWADSPDVPGWTAAGPSLEVTRTLVRDGLAFLVDDDVTVLEGSVSHPEWDGSGVG